MTKEESIVCLTKKESKMEIFNIGTKVKHIGNGPLQSRIFEVHSLKKYEDDYRTWYVCTDDDGDVFMIPSNILEKQND
jgi:hypothetical protein